MSETVTVYDLARPDIALSMDRAEFYAMQVQAFERGEEPTMAVGIVDALLFNERGELLVQKRSETKAHNPGLLDKSVGGHIQYGDMEDYTVMVETVQELQVPSITLRTEMDFDKTLRLLSGYLSTTAVVQHAGVSMERFDKLIAGKMVPVANKVFFFLGVYSGAVKNVDREARGILYYSLPELERDLEQTPEKFTHDLRSLIASRKNQIQLFLKRMNAVLQG